MWGSAFNDRTEIVANVARADSVERSIGDVQLANDDPRQTRPMAESQSGTKAARQQGRPEISEKHRDA